MFAFCNRIEPRVAIENRTPFLQEIFKSLGTVAGILRNNENLSNKKTITFFP